MFAHDNLFVSGDWLFFWDLTQNPDLYTYYPGS